MNILTSTPQVISRPRLEAKAPASTPTAAQEPQDGFSLLGAVEFVVGAVMGRHIPTTVPETSPEKLEMLKEKIKPGDVLMSSNLTAPGWGRMEYWAIGSHWTHAAFVGSDGAVYESADHGVVKTTLDEFTEGRKKIAVARFERTPEDVKAATDYAQAQVGKEYDTGFDYSGDDKFYCSELVSKALDTGDKPIKTPRGHFFGKEAIAPDAFLKIPGVQVVHDDGSNYWTNKLSYWPLAASTLGMGAVGGMVGGLAGALVGAGTGFLGSVLIGNKVQTGHFSPTIYDLAS